MVKAGGVHPQKVPFFPTAVERSPLHEQIGSRAALMSIFPTSNV